MKITATRQTDVLIVGGGASGLRAALAAAETGARVLLANKGPLARSGITLTAAGGMQAPLHPDDSPELFCDDIIRCGYGLADRDLAQTLAADAAGRVLETERYGVSFVRDAAGGYALGQFPGQSQPRNLFVRGGGIGLAGALAKACRGHAGITVLDDFFVTGLVRDAAGAVAGAVGLDLRNGELALLAAPAVVMATGGCQWLWATNDCPADATGDGLVHAYRAGAELVDMEMVLFYPSVLVWPPSLQGAFVHYEYLAPDVLDGNIYDNAGRPVLPKPLPVRDEAMLLLARAVRDGRAGPHGGLMWYVGDSPKGTAAVAAKLDILQYNYIRAHGVDPATDRVEVAPGAHYLLGGIHIDPDCRTSVRGLFAAPECAGNFDGANRLAGNGLTATQVFGARAGLAAGRWAADNGGARPDPAAVEEETARVAARLAPAKSGGTDLAALRDRLRAAVQQYAGVGRDAAGLQRLARLAGDTRAELAAARVPDAGVFNQRLVELIELENMAEIAGLVAGSALTRAETRGHHIRDDFPARDDANWLCHTLATRAADGPRFGAKPLRGR
ncbi:FAD-binding protein [Anaeroselena agilis]|uniref:FAD-binding protein n=1 Tax=Anaeroselena agilis TaxID=3063788 RepID=A0ABU3P045_9FIRM|nr:FAD-binding protein [Selenomonadales bacterium 4137-cl]